MTNEILTARTYGHIVDLSATGLKADGIADILSVSLSTVQRVVRAEKSAAAGDLDDLHKLMPQSKRIVALCCEKYGLSLDAAPAAKPAPPAEPKPDNTAQAVVSIMEVLHEISEGIKANGKALDALTADLAQLRMTVASWRGEQPGHVAKIVESVNVNGDIATKEHQKQSDLLASIKINTKRRNGGEYQ